MTTPLGTLDVTDRDRRRVSVSRRTRETEIDVSLDLDGSGLARISTGIGFYDHLLTSLAHHGLFDIEIRATGDLEVDEHHTVEDVALVLGSAFAEALGDRADPPLRRGVGADGRIARDRRDRRRWAALRGHRPAVPRRARRRSAAPTGRTRSRRSHGRPARRSTSAAAGATTTTSPRPRSRPSPARCGMRATRSAPRGRRLDEGHARMNDTRPRIAVVDYGAGNLVSIEQGLTASGAEVVIAREPEAIEGADAIVVPGVGGRARDGPPARRRLRRPDHRWIAADKPFLGVCLGLQLLFEASDEDGAQTFGVLPGRTRRLEDAPTLPHIGWNQVVRRRDHPLFDGIGDGADFYFVHSYAGARGDRRRHHPRRDRARFAVRVGGRQRQPARRPVPPRA